MFQITFYGQTINVPKDADFYAIITQKQRVYTTDFDIPITPEVLKAFEVGGLLTQENGSYFTPKTLPATLSGFGLVFDCTLTINSIKQSEHTMNITLFSPALLPTIFYEQQHDFANAYDRLVYPLIRESSPQAIYTGYKTDAGKFLLNMPVLTLGDIVDYLSQQNYGVDLDDVIDPRSICMVPMSVYCDARYKMRRVYFDCLIQASNSGLRVPFLRLFKGDYYNLLNDTCEINYTNSYRSNRLYFQNRFTLSEDCRRMRIAYSIQRSSNLIYTGNSEYYIKIEKKSKSTNTYSTFFDGVDHPILPFFWNTDDDLVIDDTTTYVDFDNLTAGEYRITFMMQDEVFNYNSGHQAFTGVMQYMFDDDCVGVRPIEGNKDDEKCEKSAGLSLSFSIQTGSFHSGCWGMNEYDYGMQAWLHNDTFTQVGWYVHDTQVRTNYRHNHGFNETFYNQSPALMFTNRLSAFQNESIFTLLQRLATLHNLRVNINHQAHTISLSHQIDPQVITDYTLYDELIFDNSHVVDNVRYKNMGEDYAVLGNNVVESDQVIMNCKTSPIVTDDEQTETYVWFNPALVSGRDANPAPEEFHGNVIFPKQFGDEEYKTTFLVKDGRYLLANNTFHGTLAVLQAVDGYAIYDESIFLSGGLNAQYRYDYPTTLNVGQVVKTKVVGVVLSDFVVYQTRVFRVLSQEIDDNGVNDLELLLYE